MIKLRHWYHVYCANRQTDKQTRGSQNSTFRLRWQKLWWLIHSITVANLSKTRVVTTVTGQRASAATNSSCKYVENYRTPYCVEWHNTVFARSGPLSVHKLFTSCIRRCLVSRACDWVMSALSAALHNFSFFSCFSSITACHGLYGSTSCCKSD